MKQLLRTVISLVVAALAVTLIAPTAAAQAAPKNPPGIKATKQYKALKAEVASLRSKRNTPATAATKAAMRRILAAKRAKADARVNYLYVKRLKFIAFQSNKQLAAKVDRIEARLNRELRALDNALDAKVAKLQRAERKAIARTRAQYADRIDNLVSQRTALRKKLAKTKNPAKRTQLIDQIDDLTGQIRVIKTERLEAIDAIETRFADKIDLVQERYTRLIAAAKKQATADIRAARDLVRAHQKDRNEGAKRRKAGEAALVKALYDLGVAYIDQMPDKA